MDEMAMWLDLIAEAKDIECAYHDAVTSQPLVLFEMAIRGTESHPGVRRNINPLRGVQDAFSRAYVRGELAKRGRVWPEGGA